MTRIHQSYRPASAPLSQDQTHGPGEAAGHQLDLSQASWEWLPRNPRIEICERSLYEVPRPQAEALAERILDGPAQPFWLLSCPDSRARPGGARPQRVLKVFSDLNEVVVQEDHHEFRCASPQHKATLTGFLAEHIGDSRALYLSLLAPWLPSSLPPPLLSSRRRQRSEEPGFEGRRIRPRLSSFSTSPPLPTGIERPDLTLRDSPGLTRQDRQTLRDMPGLYGKRHEGQQLNLSVPSEQQVAFLLAIDSGRFCHCFTDFELGVRALTVAARRPEASRRGLPKALIALIEKARDKVRRWSDIEVDSMSLLCHECRPDAASYQLLLGVLANMLVHFSPALDTGMLATVANHLSHYSRRDGSPMDTTVGQAIDWIARQYQEGQRPTTSKYLSLLANCFGKWPERRHCMKALAAMADDLNQGHFSLKSALFQQLSLLANAWSKGVDWDECVDALVQIATDLHQNPRRLEGASSQYLSLLANAWSKGVDHPDPIKRHACVGALVQIANAWYKNPRLLQKANAQYLSLLANAWSKGVDHSDPIKRRACVDALARIAIHCRQNPRRLEEASSQYLSLLANAWSKGVDHSDPDKRHACVDALVQIATDLHHNPHRLEGASSQHLANLANAWSKGVDHPDPDKRHACVDALVRIAIHCHQNPHRLEEASSQHLANLANAWSKGVDRPECVNGLVQIADACCRNLLRLEGASSQDLSLLANAWSKGVDHPDLLKRHACVSALVRLAGHLQQNPRCLEKDNPHGLANLANLANAWSSGVDHPECRTAINQVAARLLCAMDADGVDIHYWSLVAHALARAARGATVAGHSDIATEAHEHLIDLALRLEESPARFDRADIQSLSMLLRALGRAGLRDERRRLAPVMLTRLAQLQQQTPPFPGTTLETFGHLCIGLRPLAMQNQRRQRAMRGQVLLILDRLQPVVARVLSQQTASADDTRQSRLPAMSVRHVFETYMVLAHTLRPRHLPKRENGQPEAGVLRQRRKALQQWLATEETRLQALLEVGGRHDAHLWALQARLQAPGTGPGGALDRLVAARADALRARQPASVFDVRASLAAMDHPPRPPQGDAGLYQPPRIDSGGRPLQQADARRYYVLSHLTGGRLPFTMVEFGQVPGLAMLERPIVFGDQFWRADLVGGSRMKKGQVRASQLMKTEGERPEGPQLMALRLSETLPGSAYDTLARALMPAREDFFRFQRMFLSSPPTGIDRLGPHDHVLQGAFRIGILPDIAPDRAEHHGFRFNDAQGRRIALQPHDGCGFIRQSLLDRLPVCQKARDQGLAAFATRVPGNLPGQALQHYPRSEAVAREVDEQLARRLKDKAPPQGDELFRAVTTGLIQGSMAVAVPSADDRVHLSTIKAADFLQHRDDGVLIGRSPYDKPNLRPFMADDVATAAQGDPTATFLDQCTTLQYSYVGDHARSNDRPSALFACKGLLIGIPDAYWPAPDIDIVMSANDVKTHSDWTESKQRAKEDVKVHSRGLLVANEIFAPGSVIAIPRDAQQRLDGDFDGDTVVIVAGRPALFAHVYQFDKDQPISPVLKPPKTHSSPFDGEHYQHGRSRDIVPVYAGVMEQFSTLQTRCLAQPEAVRHTLAERMRHGSFEGLPKGWKGHVRAALEDRVEAAKKDALCQVLLDQQERAPACSDASRSIERALLTQLGAWQHGEEVSVVLPDTDDLHGMTILREDCRAAHDTVERIEALLNGYPERQLSSRVGYDPGDVALCLRNLLSLGIKAGTDAYKSQTGVYEFRAVGRRLDMLLRHYGTVAEAPYTKGTARRLANKRFNVTQALQALDDNPTLAASVMEAALASIEVKKALEGQTPDAGPSPGNRQSALRLATELQARARAHHGTVAGVVEVALKACADKPAGPMLFHRDQECKGRNSIRDKILRGQQLNDSAGPVPGAKNINDALRFHVQLDAQAFLVQYQKIAAALEKQGVRRLRTRNCFTLGEAARYKGINVTCVITTDGETLPFEIQFHTEQSRTVKQQNHKLYKDAQKRQLHRGEAEAEHIKQLEETMRQRCRAVVTPPDVAKIVDSGGDWPAAGLWPTLSLAAPPDEPLEDEAAEDDDEIM